MHETRFLSPRKQSQCTISNRIHCLGAAPNRKGRRLSSPNFRPQYELPAQHLAQHQRHHRRLWARGSTLAPPLARPLVGKAGPVALGSNESVVLNYLARAPRYVALLEDQAAGQHIWGWELHAHPRGGVGWTLLARGESIGHKCSQVLASKSTVSPCKCSQVLLTTIRGFSPPCYENL